MPTGEHRFARVAANFSGRSNPGYRAGSRARKDRTTRTGKAMAHADPADLAQRQRQADRVCHRRLCRLRRSAQGPLTRTPVDSRLAIEKNPLPPKSGPGIRPRRHPIPSYRRMIKGGYLAIAVLNRSSPMTPILTRRGISASNHSPAASSAPVRLPNSALSSLRGQSQVPRRSSALS